MRDVLSVRIRYITLEIIKGNKVATIPIIIMCLGASLYSRVAALMLERLGAASCAHQFSLYYLSVMPFFEPFLKHFMHAHLHHNDVSECTRLHFTHTRVLFSSIRYTTYHNPSNLSSFNGYYSSKLFPCKTQ